MLHIDIPTLEEFKALAQIKGETYVSLYLPTSPWGAAQIENTRRSGERRAEDAAEYAITNLARELLLENRRRAANGMSAGLLLAKHLGISGRVSRG